jgi:ATP synthase protein I
MPEDKNDFGKYARFSSLGVQMAVIIGGFCWLGVFLDEKYKSEHSIYTIILSLSGVAIALYLIIREVIKISKDEE